MKAASPIPVAAPTVGDCLRSAADRLRGAGVEPPRLTAETLLAHALDCERVTLYAHPERAVEDAAAEAFARLVERRAAGEPTQHLLGRQEFYGREMEVGPAAFIPRPETELLVETALENFPQARRIVDVGTGSGCIAVTLAKELDRPVTAIEIAAETLAVARRNAAYHGASVRFVQGDLLSAARTASLDLAVSNPPYVARRDEPTLQREVRFEPARALFGGEDGLDVYRRLIPQAERALRPGGGLALELGYDSLPGVLELLRAGRWSAIAVREDLAGIPRVISAERLAG
ncbi:MAG: peptide chain release factor N(5)-glutamine methyltransferase [Acidobacteria bacterium]|nr:peptide chain release factor N(5)-glutamine methyltransferase [Acidobacteriota bacterium]